MAWGMVMTLILISIEVPHVYVVHVRILYIVPGTIYVTEAA